MVNGGLMINNQSMMVNGGSWWFMNVHDCSWWFGNKPWLIASTRSHATPSTNNWNNTKIFKPSWKDYFTKHESTIFWRWSRDVRLQTWCLLLSLCFFAKNSSKLESPATHFTPSQQKKKAESSFRFLANGQHVSNFGSWNWTKSSKQDHRKSGPLPSSYCLGLWRSPVRVQRRPSRPVIKKMERTIWPKKWWIYPLKSHFNKEKNANLSNFWVPYFQTNPRMKSWKANEDPNKDPLHMLRPEKMQSNNPATQKTFRKLPLFASCIEKNYIYIYTV